MLPVGSLSDGHVPADRESVAAVHVCAVLGDGSAFQTALIAAFPTLTIQCFADGQVSGNALVVTNDQMVISVAPNNYAGYNGGVWAQYPAAKMAGGANSLFTTYP